MRLLAGIFLIAVLSRTVAAEDEDPDVRPASPLGFAIYFTGHGGAIGGVAEGGMGPTVELALGAGRAQYFLEGSVAWVALGTEQVVTGVMARGGLGARWIARSFELGDSGALEMTIGGLAGASKIWWDQGGELVRPEFGFGVGIQMRKFHRPRTTFRFDLRVFFAPTDDVPIAAARCASACASSSPITNGGLMVSMGGGL